MDALVQILVRDNEQMRAKLATLEQRDHATGMDCLEGG